MDNNTGGGVVMLAVFTWFVIWLVTTLYNLVTTRRAAERRERDFAARPLLTPRAGASRDEVMVALETTLATYVEHAHVCRKLTTGALVEAHSRETARLAAHYQILRAQLLSMSAT
ncbi:hypothetical protein EFK50_01370 [Nocardioides marmoriginsengisoli]|uniref:Uncharacterized protein n=1 Tax=Nocardioides marmoriginsengisoli TaxID=661483 RepID=A0A3N0CRU1_9ACTN|nr:hypothetical protein [Nocardioides marmoriginsengisoli]RNL65726.1 hypothetical protein EFK50_01370 [Nocardioides marmoriginsengisoli]